MRTKFDIYVLLTKLNGLMILPCIFPVNDDFCFLGGNVQYFSCLLTVHVIGEIPGENNRSGASNLQTLAH